MPSTILRRLVLAMAVAMALAGTFACQSQPEPEKAARPATTGPSTAPAAQLKNEIPSDALEPVMKAHFEGVGNMEQYKYGFAVQAFREVHKLAPGWIPGSINLAIALLNDSGVKAEDAKKAGGGAEPATNFDEALDLLAAVIEREPGNPHAHFCRGIILEQDGKLSEANRHFRKVAEIDPTDATAWYWVASTLTDPDDPTRPAGPKQAKEQIELLGKAVELNPYLTPAVFKMATAYRMTGQNAKQKELLDRWRKINPDRPDPVPGPGDSAEKVYGEMGKYATIIDPFARPASPAGTTVHRPRFEAPKPIEVKLSEGTHWAVREDFTGPREVIWKLRVAFGVGVAAFDADGDGKLDLYMASAVTGKKGVRDALLLNRGDGRFEEAAMSFGLPEDRASIGVAAADFDADRFIDLFLTGIGDNRLLRNKGGKSFEDVSGSLKPCGPPALALTARWLDLDQDGDLDLYIVNFCAAADAARAFAEKGEPPAGVANVAYRNDGRPEPIPGSPEPAWAPIAMAVESVKAKSGLSIAMTPWPGAPALAGKTGRHTGVAALDLDGDRDLDLVVAEAGKAPTAVLNDRLGQFHEAPMEGLASVASAGLLVTDLDADGRADLIATDSQGPVRAWRNVTEHAGDRATRIRFESSPIDATRWCSAQAIDLDLDGLPDLLGRTDGPAARDGGGRPLWSRNEGKRFATEPLPVDAMATEQEPLLVLDAVDLVGDPLPDLLTLSAGKPPTIARNLGNGQHWLALQLDGHWQVRKSGMRTNSHGIGTRLLLEGQGTHVTYFHTTPDSGLGQSIAPIVVGLGKSNAVDLINIAWPDGVMQGELNLAADQRKSLVEVNRKPSSCPVLFTWNGERFVCLGDFLGGGGLGYLVAPGVYNDPDRDESVAISGDQLRPYEGVLRVSVTEPMDEVSYVDHLRLEVVDRPPGVNATPDERFAPEGPRPTGELIAWRTRVDPVKAADLDGRDLTDTLRDWDRRTADAFKKRAPWIGYAEDHGIVLDFGGRLAKYSPRDRLVLCLAGWVEYPYSQTNYAAATAGVTLKPPTIERRRDDGTWEVIEPHAGYPAGLPRLMTIELTGKLTGPSCVLRIRTNMECYYDQAFLALLDESARESLQVTTLPVARATLGHRGYTREVSPDGRPPLLYDYDYVDPAPLAWFSGKLTRYGDVAELLQNDDDRLCLVGPGDEIRVEFDAKSLPAPRPGWTRSYVLRSYGYCKDADPFTAMSDTVEPLPWKGMPAFPFDAAVKRPADPGYSEYLRKYQTRAAGGN